MGHPDAVLNTAVLGLPDGSTLELIEFSKPEDRAIYKPQCQDIGSFHLGLQVERLDLLLPRTEAMGWQKIGPVTVLDRGSMAGWDCVFVRNEDGTTLELFGKPH